MFQKIGGLEMLPSEVFRGNLADGVRFINHEVVGARDKGSLELTLHDYSTVDQGLPKGSELRRMFINGVGT